MNKSAQAGVLDDDFDGWYCIQLLLGLIDRQQTDQLTRESAEVAATSAALLQLGHLEHEMV